jgi:hypothetical protein
MKVGLLILLPGKPFRHNTPRLGGYLNRGR